MSGTSKHERTQREIRRRDNAAVFGERRSRLRCGHETVRLPVATLGKKMWFDCPEGCGLQRGRHL